MHTQSRRIPYSIVKHRKPGTVSDAASAAATGAPTNQSANRPRSLGFELEYRIPCDACVPAYAAQSLHRTERRRLMHSHSVALLCAPRSHRFAHARMRRRVHLTVHGERTSADRAATTSRAHEKQFPRLIGTHTHKHSYTHTHSHKTQMCACAYAFYVILRGKCARCRAVTVDLRACVRHNDALLLGRHAADVLVFAFLFVCVFRWFFSRPGR